MAVVPTAAKSRESPITHDPAEFFVLRAAVLPIDTLRAGAGATKDPSRSLASSPSASELPDPRLQAWLHDPLVQAAIYLASPTLSQRLCDWLSEPSANGLSSFQPALFRYLVRMTTRATPFGLMASFTTGCVGSTSCLELGSRDGLRRSSWFDLGFVYPLVGRLTARPEVRKELSYTLNTTFFRHDDGWRYVEQIETSERRERILTRVGASEVLDLIAAHFRVSHGVKPAELSAFIMRTVADVGADEVSDFVNQLIDAQILIPTLTPTLTGPDPVQHVLRQSERVASLAEFHREFEATVESLAAIDRQAEVSLRDSYRTLATTLQSQFEAAGERHLFHVDLRREAPGLSLDRAIVPVILSSVEALRRICGASWPHTVLDDFRNRFEERYGDREIDLLAALDEDAGIGFEVDLANRRNEGLLKDFRFGEEPNAERTQLDTKRVRRLLRLIERASSQGWLAAALSEEDVEELAAADAEPLPDVLTVLGSLGPGRPSDDWRRPCFVLRSVVSGAGLFGRFCRADAGLSESLKALFQREEALRPEAVFAEIVHLPEDRIGNVVCRPALRSKELPYLGECGLPAEDRIFASDLLVSVRAARIVLRSRSLGREVLPRMSCAQNAQARNASVYRFLAALALQDGASGLAFSWGPIFAEARFLPRIAYESVILAPASWWIDPADALLWAKCAPPERAEKIRSWRAERAVPRWIQVGQFDNLLSLDLEDPACVDALLDEIRRAKVYRVSEMIPAPDDLCVTSPEGHHVHEVMLPFVRRSRESTSEVHANEPQNAPCERRFAPGSRWLYVKLYGSNLATERTLVSDLFEWLGEARAAGSLDRWHFVRYRDSADHLRVRFQVQPESLRPDVQPKLEKLFRRWSDTNTIWRVQYDTYEREIRRYGGPDAIEFAESIFDADSEVVVELLRSAPVQASSDWRWLLSMKLADCYGAAFGWDLDARRQNAELVERSFRAEFRVGKQFEGDLSRRYRADRVMLEDLLEERAALPQNLAWANSAVSRFRSRLAPLAAWFCRESAKQSLMAPLPNIVQSFIHMHVNRMMLSNPREHEMILHAFLSRAYRSGLMRVADSSRKGDLSRAD